jgi:chemotaxis protein histidine kinase CheA/CheY-like chemotaxis protein
MPEKIHSIEDNAQDPKKFEENFHRDVLHQLWEMVKILKQEDRQEHRKELQSHCQYLLDLGKGGNLPKIWSELLETAYRAIANPENSYRTSGKLIVKEIKQAADLVLAGRVEEIEIGEKLQNLAPSFSSIQINSELDWEESPEIYDQKPINLSNDFWGEEQPKLSDDLTDHFPNMSSDKAEELVSLFDEEESYKEAEDMEMSFLWNDRSSSSKQHDLDLEDFSNLEIENLFDETEPEPSVTEEEDFAAAVRELENLVEDDFGLEIEPAKTKESQAESTELILDDLEQLLEYDNIPAHSSTTPALVLGKDNAILSICFYAQFEELESLLNEPPSLREEANASTYFQELERLINAPSTTIKHSQEIIEEPWVPAALRDDDSFNDLEKLLEQTNSGIGLQPASLAAARTAKGKAQEHTMRVPVKQLDNLNNLIGELVVKRNSLEEDQERLHRFLDNLTNQVQNLSDVGSRMQELYERSLLEGALMASRDAATNYAPAIVDNSGVEDSDDDLKPLEIDRFTDFHLLSQEMIELIVRVRESASDIQFLADKTEQLSRNLRQVTTQLQEGMTKCRMVPFSQTADRLPRAIRDISLKLHKQAKLEVEGRDVLIDKMILESLYDPMTHLVNNAITHGIESPEERKELGKVPVGNILVRAFFQGNQTVISVSDDGAGINPERVKAKAIEKGLLSKEEAKFLSTQEVYEFLFHPGFSTRDQADDFAGRGVGMDVVRSKLNSIRGTVGIDSKLGQGTTFTIRLPLTLSIGKALFCLSSHASIAFPIDGVEDTQEYAPGDIQMNAEGKPCVSWRDGLLPFRPLNELLVYNRPMSRSPVYGGKEQDDIISIVVLRGAGNFLAVQVDRIVTEQEIVIKQIEGPAPKPTGIAGATVLGDGRIMPIADVLELIEIAQGRISIEPNNLWKKTTVTSVRNPVTVKSSEPTVLIIDDSITVRELLSLSFTKLAYRVEQARDGQEAWEKLRSGLPCDLIFCDIEMPRMNGLELLSQIQKDEQLSQIPVAMLTSRGAERHRKLAAKLGACGYFTKPYTEKDLLDAAQRMMKGEVLLSGSSRVATPIKPEIEEPKQVEVTPGKSRPKAEIKFEPRVLVIDDSVIVREMVSMTFSKSGYKVEQARDGQDAWEKLQSGLPCDLIICDIEMPRMNGLEFLSHIQEDEKLADIPIGMLTSRGAQKMKKIAAQRGAKAYFVKPYVEKDLLEAAKRLLQGDVLLDNTTEE